MRNKNKDKEISKMLFSCIDNWLITGYLKRKLFQRRNELAWISKERSTDK
jgi:hypothetical protein